MARLNEGDAFADEDGERRGNNKDLWRTYGALDCRFYLFPALTGWANVCCAYGAGDSLRMTGARGESAEWRGKLAATKNAE